jgi:hypothetical protein
VPHEAEYFEIRFWDMYNLFVALQTEERPGLLFCRNVPFLKQMVPRPSSQQQKAVEGEQTDICDATENEIWGPSID